MAQAEIEKKEKCQREGIQAKKERGEWNDYGRPATMMIDAFAKEYTKVQSGELRQFQLMKQLGINQIVHEVNEAVYNMTECIQVIMHFLEKTVVTDYNSFSKVGERYEEDAQTFNTSMQHIYSEISDLNDKINNIAQTIENVNETISESTEGVSLIAEKSGDAVSKTLEGCNHLRDSENNLNLLKSLIEKFEV